ncbi:MAG: efflux RND transporter periplasmic adaptor subunit [Rhizobacter sp.]
MNVSKRPSRARRLTHPLALILMAAALAGAGWWAWTTYGRGANPREQYQLAAVQRGDIEDLVTATGTVQPRDYVDVGAQVSGQLKRLHVEVGSQVQAGDLLAEIDPTVLKATADARRAGLRSQRATLTERQSALALAELQLRRQKNLTAADATTTEALQLAEAAVRSAKAQAASVQAQIEQTESALRADEANLNYARIYAPMTGTVVSVTARQGQTLNANQSAPTILRVADLTTMTVQTQVSEAEVSKLRRGMEVYFTTLGGQGRRWYGSLRKVEPTPTVTNNVVLYNALFDVPNTNQALMPNMTAQVFFIAAAAQDVLLVPTAAVTMTRNAGASGRGARRDRAAGEVPGRPESASAPAAGTSGASAPANPASAPRGRGRRPSGDAAALEPSAAAASGPVDRGTAGGFVGQAAPRAPRRGTVRVIDAQGVITERPVELGVVTRVQAQVLSGLAEDDEVITGMKPPAAAQRNASTGAPSGGGLTGAPGGLPPGAGRGR